MPRVRTLPRDAAEARINGTLPRPSTRGCPQAISQGPRFWALAGHLVRYVRAGKLACLPSLAAGEICQWPLYQEGNAGSWQRKCPGRRGTAPPGPRGRRPGSPTGIRIVPTGTVTSIGPGCPRGSDSEPRLVPLRVSGPEGLGGGSPGPVPVPVAFDEPAGGLGVGPGLGVGVGTWCQRHAV